VSDRGITRTGVRPTTGAAIMGARAGDIGLGTDTPGQFMAGRHMATPAAGITARATLDSTVAAATTVVEAMAAATGK